MNINWTTLATVLSALAGVVGSVLTPVYGTQLAAQTADVLQAVSGLLVLIAGYHVTAVATAVAKAKIPAPVAAKK